MIVQSWTNDSSYMHAERGGKLILSPGPRIYLDQKYDSSTVLGHKWAGSVDLEKAYSWDPGAFLPGVTANAILGVEATLFAETLVSRHDYEYMAFPRVIAAAELGWSQPNRLGWEGFRQRIAAHGARLAALGVNFARAPGVSWTW
jgi:hexosaminidase